MKHVLARLLTALLVMSSFVLISTQLACSSNTRRIKETSLDLDELNKNAPPVDSSKKRPKRRTR